MVAGGRCNTVRILSLYMRAKPGYEQCARETSRARAGTPDAFAKFGFVDPVPDAEYILVLAYADRAPAYLRPRVLVWRRDAGKLVTNEGEDKVLPDAVRDAFAEAEDPLAAGKVEGVLPDGAADALVEEEVVSRGQEARRRVQVRPEGPEGLDGSKGGDLLDALLVVGNFVARRALLTEPENPSVRGTGWSSPSRMRGLVVGRRKDVRTCCGGDG